MKSDDLRFFRAVALSGSFGAAARALNTTQSNVTARIQKLEESLGLALFRRHARGVRITPAGERLMPFAEQVGNLLQEARRHVTDVGHANGDLRVGAMETTTTTRLGGMLAEYTETFPDVDLSLTTGTTAELVDAVLDRTLDVAFVCGPIRHARLMSLPFMVEDMTFMLPPGKQSLDGIGERRLRAFVLKMGCAYRKRLEDVLIRRGFVNHQIVEYGTVDAIAASVSAGLGVTLMPTAVCASYAPRYRWSTERLSDDERFVETVAVLPKQSTISTALREFLALLDRHNAVSPAARIVPLIR